MKAIITFESCLSEEELKEFFPSAIRTECLLATDSEETVKLISLEVIK
jgi:hypothetical protein